MEGGGGPLSELDYPKALSLAEREEARKKLASMLKRLLVMQKIFSTTIVEKALMRKLKNLRCKLRKIIISRFVRPFRES